MTVIFLQPQIWSVFLTAVTHLLQVRNSQTLSILLAMFAKARYFYTLLPERDLVLEPIGSVSNHTELTLFVSFCVMV